MIRTMSGLRLRPLQESDLDALSVLFTPEGDPWSNVEFMQSDLHKRRFSTDGGISDDSGLLSIEDERGQLIGHTSWYSIHHAPTRAATALNVGVALFASARGRGYGAEAHRQLVRYLFATKLIGRIEAVTGADNPAERRTLESVGFSLEGILRHAGYWDGEWRDFVMYSILRGENIR